MNFIVIIKIFKQLSDKLINSSGNKDIVYLISLQLF